MFLISVTLTQLSAILYLIIKIIIKYNVLFTYLYQNLYKKEVMNCGEVNSIKNGIHLILPRKSHIFR